MALIGGTPKCASEGSGSGWVWREDSRVSRTTNKRRSTAEKIYEADVTEEER